MIIKIAQLLSDGTTAHQTTKQNPKVTDGFLRIYAVNPKSFTIDRPAKQENNELLYSAAQLVYRVL